MRKYNIILLSIILFIGLVGATTLESYGTKKVNEQFSFCQVCSNANYVTLSSIETPNSTLRIDTNMTSMGSGEFCYNYTPTLVGRYDFRGISDGCELTYATYVEVTYTGEQYDTSQIGVIIGEAILIAVFLVLGFSFSKEKWKLRGFFFILALFIVIVAINSLRVLSGSSQILGDMTSNAFMIGIVAVSFMVVYLLIFYTIELFKNLKNKKEMKWEVSNKYS